MLICTEFKEKQFGNQKRKCEIILCVNFKIKMNSGKSNSESSNGLENIDIHGQEFLRDALTSCTDPLKAIEEIQVDKESYVTCVYRGLSLSVFPTYNIV